ncbi:hypothetical protein EDB83DRAFT_2412572 [Lactarius deliciosus]|nr:hypothetical protein EDB83DRAFT_2412572 [Lactarius deliciosus]
MIPGDSKNCVGLLRSDPSHRKRILQQHGNRTWSQKDELILSLPVPCSFDSEVSFRFGNGNFTLQPRTFNFGTYCDSPNACVGGIVANDDGEHYASLCFWVLEDVFLENVYGIRRRK